LFEGRACRESATDAIENDRAFLFLALSEFTFAQPGSELPNDKSHDEEHSEHRPVLRFTDKEGVSWWNEQIVPSQGAQGGEREDWSASQHGTGECDSEQIDQCDSPVSDDWQGKKPDHGHS
jgi:hypothetical protein